MGAAFSSVGFLCSASEPGGVTVVAGNPPSLTAAAGAELAAKIHSEVGGQGCGQRRRRIVLKAARSSKPSVAGSGIIVKLKLVPAIWLVGTRKRTSPVMWVV